MICFCPEERLSISEILSSPWMREGDFGVNNYKVLKEESESMKMVEKLNANICFVNGVYLEMMRMEEEKQKLQETRLYIYTDVL